MGAFSDTVRSIGMAKMVVMTAVAAATLGFFILVIFRMSAANMVPLYTNLSLEDSSKIAAELDKTGIPYEFGSNGSQISVPSERVLRLRMSMAQAGLPSGGSIVGYEIFDRSDSFGSSSFVMNVNMMRALEGELSRTIGSLAGVDTARVHLVVPKRELFSRDRDKPSASVTIKMRGGQALERSEVNAISHLVAAAVPGLEASRVTVVDGHGRLLARGTGDANGDAAADTAQEYRTAYENNLKNKLEELLERVVGPGKVRVQVAADMNFDRIVTNTEKYDPEGQVARSTQTTTQKESSQEGGGKDNVSVTTNLPDAGKGGEGAGASNRSTEQAGETTNYEISKTVMNHVQEGGTVKKISVATLVDGIYTADAEGNQTYAPRGDDELKKLKTLIATAIGYDEKRGDTIEIVNMRFTEETALGEESFFQRFKLEVQGILQTLIIAVVAILAILLVLRPAVKQLTSATGGPAAQVAGDLAALQGPAGGAAAAGAGAAAVSAAAANAMARLPGAGTPPQQTESELLIDVANIKGGMKSSSMKKIAEIVDKYPEETMGVLRQWIIRQS